jgi:hypothetical protein
VEYLRGAQRNAVPNHVDASQRLQSGDVDLHATNPLGAEQRVTLGRQEARLIYKALADMYAREGYNEGER